MIFGSIVKRTRGVCLMVLALCALSAASAHADDAPSTAIQAPPSAVVSTALGDVRGVLVEGIPTVSAYRGVPFAAPPVGDLRWKPPTPAQSWTGVRECVVYGSAAPQLVNELLASYPGWALNAPQNEDCLYLNVYSPEVSGEAALPVMVWIHGGGYTAGAGSQGLYDGQYLARQGVVVVTINYRLGALGFLAHPALDAESSKGVSGNYGILDQIAALEWVRDNIRNFGGDPERVTIFGESAGGGSVYSLLVSPLAAGLFHGAIAQSPATLYPKHLREPRWGSDPMQEIGVAFAEEKGVADAEDIASALRGLSVEEILADASTDEVPAEIDFNRDGMVFAPVVDGYVIPDDPAQLFETGRFNRVPLMIGANKDEGTMFSFRIKMPSEPAAYTSLMESEFGSAANALIEAFPGSNTSEIRRSITSLYGDFIFVAPARRVARAWAAADVPVFFYFFTRRPRNGPTAMLGAHHGSEIRFAFGNEALFTDISPGEEDLLATMKGAWVEFAKTGAPSDGNGAIWPEFSLDDRAYVELGDGAQTEHNLRATALDAVDAYIRTRSMN